MFASKITSAPHWSIRTWLNYLQKEEDLKRDSSIGWIHSMLIPSKTTPHASSQTTNSLMDGRRVAQKRYLNLRAFQGNTVGKHINPTVQDNVLLPDNFAEHIYHAGSSHDTHSIIQSGLITGGKDVKQGRRAVFFTSVNSMFIGHYRGQDYDLTQPKTAVYKHNWKEHQKTVDLCNLRVAQSKGLRLHQTRSNAITLNNILPAVW